MKININKTVHRCNFLEIIFENYFCFKSEVILFTYKDVNFYYPSGNNYLKRVSMVSAVRAPVLKVFRQIRMSKVSLLIMLRGWGV